MNALPPQSIDDGVSRRFHVDTGLGLQPPPGWALEARSRKVFSKIFDSWPQTGCIGLPVPQERMREIVDSGGHLHDADRIRAYCERRYVVQPDFQPFAPFIARRSIEPIVVQTVPRNAPAGNLETFLSAESWQQLVDRTLDRAGGLCEACGSGPETCTAHEMWEYDAPDDPAAEGVARLVRTISVCEDCHSMFHPVLAKLRNRFDTTVARLGAVNEWSEDETRSMYAWDERSNEEKSGYDWVMDLSAIAEDGHVVISSDWSIDERTWRLVKPDANGHCSTLPLGIDFVLAGGEYPAVSPEAHYLALRSSPSP